MPPHRLDQRGSPTLPSLAVLLATSASPQQNRLSAGHAKCAYRQGCPALAVSDQAVLGSTIRTHGQAWNHSGNGLCVLQRRIISRSMSSGSSAMTESSTSFRVSLLGCSCLYDTVFHIPYPMNIRALTDPARARNASSMARWLP